MAQFSSSYTSTSNRIRDSTGRLASMAPHDGDDRDDGNAGVGQDTRQQQQRQRPQGGVWVTHSSAGPSGHQLGSDLHFQTGKRNDSAMSTQDLLRTSPRAQPHQGPSFRNPAQAAAAKLPQPQLPAEEQASIQGRARMQASLGGAPDAAHALPNAASNINAMLTESRGIAASSIAPNPSWDTFVFPMVVMRSPSSSAPPTYSSRLQLMSTPDSRTLVFDGQHLVGELEWSLRLWRECIHSEHVTVRDCLNLNIKSMPTTEGLVVAVLIDCHPAFGHAARQEARQVYARLYRALVDCGRLTSNEFESLCLSLELRFSTSYVAPEAGMEPNVRGGFDDKHASSNVLNVTEPSSTPENIDGIPFVELDEDAPFEEPVEDVEEDVDGVPLGDDLLPTGLQSLLRRVTSRMQANPVMTKQDARRLQQDALLISAMVEVEYGVDGIPARHGIGQDCEEDGVVDGNTTQIPLYIPAAGRLPALLGGLTQTPIPTPMGSGHDIWDSMIDTMHQRADGSLAAAMEARTRLLPWAAALQRRARGAEPVRTFIQSGLREQAVNSLGRAVVKRKTLEQSEGSAPPHLLFLGTFAMSADHLFDRLEGEGTCYTAEVIGSIARDSPWGDVAAFTDTNFFPHAVQEREHLDDEVGHAMTTLSLRYVLATGARILVVTAGSNRERVTLGLRDEISEGIDITDILKIRSILVRIGAYAYLLLFVPHFSALTPRAEMHVLLDTINVFEALVRALDALWDRDKSVLERPLPPPVMSRIWPLLAERLSDIQEAYLVAATVRAFGEDYPRDELLRAAERSAGPATTWTRRAR